MSVRASGVAALLTALLVFPVASGAARSGKSLWEAGVFGGLLFPDSDFTGQGPDADDFAAPLGVQALVPLGDRWGLFADGYSSTVGSSRPAGDARFLSLRAGARILLPDRTDRIQFFLDAGAGYLNVDPDSAGPVDRPFLSAGFGQRFRIGNHWIAHWEARADRTFDDDGDDSIAGNLTSRHILVGLSRGFGGGGPAADGDHDGVSDAADACPGTPRGAGVDESGCPTDGDGDGAWDGLDECPDTPTGLSVDARGCPDRDSDGVTDDRDRCPDTPAGWAVDRSGCLLDSDDDGVADGADVCPDTPRGVEVDPDGCPKPARLFVPDAETGEAGALVLEGVGFEPGSAKLTAESRGILDGVAASLLAWPDVRVEIGGHTDSRGAASPNRELSRRRAAAVKGYLTAKGVAGDRLGTRGYGEDAPLATNDTPEGRARNRRVELRRTD